MQSTCTPHDIATASPTEQALLYSEPSPRRHEEQREEQTHLVEHPRHIRPVHASRPQAEESTPPPQQHHTDPQRVLGRGHGGEEREDPAEPRLQLPQLPPTSRCSAHPVRARDRVPKCKRSCWASCSLASTERSKDDKYGRSNLKQTQACVSHQHCHTLEPTSVDNASLRRSSCKMQAATANL